MILLFAIVLLGIALVAFTTTMTIRQRTPSSNIRKEPLYDQKDLLRREDQFISVLLRLKATTTRSLSQLQSGPAQALQWLVQDDPLQLQPTKEREDVLLARFALAALYFSTTINNNNKWKNHDKWLTQATVCEWHGVTCFESEDTATTLVIQLNLADNHLKGSLPLELKALHHLRAIDLSRNELTGSIREDWFSDWTHLQSLRLHTNHLQGKLSSILAPTLREISLHQNQLTGSIPTSVLELSRLQVLYLQNNLLTGVFPDGESTLASLNYLHLHSNRIQGTIPAALLPSMTNLVELSFADNDLTGNIPTKLKWLSNLEMLRLERNELEGLIPSVFRYLPQLTDLQMGNNRFRSELPTDFHFLSNLKWLAIESNGMTGTIPRGWGGMINLEVLLAHDNDLVGSIDRKLLMSLTSLQELWLKSNLLVGTIPSEIGVMKNLTNISLQSNSFRGTLPSEFGMLSMLERLVVDQTHLSGSAPAEVCNLRERKLDALEMDCKSGQVECSCCTKCT